jgi:hypothetical protein
LKMLIVILSLVLITGCNSKNKKSAVELSANAAVEQEPYQITFWQGGGFTGLTAGFIRDNWYYFIDAQTGAILEKYNVTNFDGPATALATAVIFTTPIESYHNSSIWRLAIASNSTLKRLTFRLFLWTR